MNNLISGIQVLLFIRFSPVALAGFEDFSITRLDQPPENGGSIFNFNLAADCWISGVRSEIGANHHVTISQSAHVEIRGSYFRNAYNNGNGGNGYGISVGNNSSNCLIEDNIFEGLRHALILGGSANGNVFGYNASYNKPVRELG